MRIVVGSDHGGYSLKHDVVAALRQDGHDVLDVGRTRSSPWIIRISRKLLEAP